MGNCLGPRLSWVNLFGLDDLEPSPFSGVATRDLFRDKELELDQLKELAIPTH